MDNSFDNKEANQNGFDSGPSCFFFSPGNFGIFVSWSKLILQFLYSLSVVLLPKQSISDYFSILWSVFKLLDDQI